VLDWLTYSLPPAAGSRARHDVAASNASAYRLEDKLACTWHGCLDDDWTASPSLAEQAHPLVVSSDGIDRCFVGRTAHRASRVDI